jgi:hypothetical protein
LVPFGELRLDGPKFALKRRDSRAHRVALSLRVLVLFPPPSRHITLKALARRAERLELLLERTCFLDGLRRRALLPRELLLGSDELLLGSDELLLGSDELRLHLRRDATMGH